MVNILVTRLDVSACILLIIIDRMLYDFLMEIFIDYIHMNKLETRNKNNNIYSLKLKCNCSKEKHTHFGGKSTLLVKKIILRMLTLTGCRQVKLI